MRITGHKLEKGEYGWLYLSGEVQNNNPFLVKYVEIKITYRDAAGGLVDIRPIDGYTFSNLSGIPPDRAPFAKTLTDESKAAQVKTYELRLEGTTKVRTLRCLEIYKGTVGSPEAIASSTPSPTPADCGLRMTSHELQRGKYGWLYLTGEVQNNNPFLVKFVKIYDTYHDASGTLVDSDFTFTRPRDIRPTDKSPFSSTLTDETKAAQVKTYELRLEGSTANLDTLRCLEIYKGTVGSPEVTASSTPSPTPTRMPTATPGTTQAPLTPTPEPTATPPPQPLVAATPTPTPTPPPSGTRIGNGESVAVQCGSGGSAIDVRYVGGSNLGIAGKDISRTIETGGSTELVASVTSATGAPGGSLLQWTMRDYTSGGAAAYIDGCTARVVAGTRAGTINLLVQLVVPTPPPGSVEGGPTNAIPGRIAWVSVTAPTDTGGGGGGQSCGNEYLQVSISGPYSYSVNQFDIMGPGTGYLWSTGYVNARTFQPITPGTYTISVNTGVFAGTYTMTVPNCGFARFIKSA